MLLTALLAVHAAAAAALLVLSRADKVLVLDEPGPWVAQTVPAAEERVPA